MEQYAMSSASNDCDHAYALYNLMGKDRKFLEVDYSSSSMHRLRTVLTYMIERESLPKAEIMSIANLLRKQLGVKDSEWVHGLASASNSSSPKHSSSFEVRTWLYTSQHQDSLCLEVEDWGYVVTERETDESLKFRESLVPLEAIRAIAFHEDSRDPG